MQNRLLLIIGNGFDLNCGLKSSFSDFFDLIIEKEVDIYLKTPITAKINCDTFNIWYLLFYCQKKHANIFANENLGISTIDSWADFESFIKYVVATENNSIISAIENFLHLRTTRNEYGEIYRNENFLQNDIKHYIYNHLYRTVNGSLTKNKVISYLFSELSKFENAFSTYIKQQANEISDYKKKNRKLIVKMIGHYTNYLILNFNYTKTIFNESGLTPLEINIHGIANNRNIIIGIDCNETKANSDGVIFTKTYRKLNSPKLTCSLVKRIDEIMIYGHSLGEQDYSYFLSIFDYYQIYDSNVSLKFLFSNYAETEEENTKNKQEYVTKVYKLMDKYGETFDNKSKGKNLLHKMLLEGRICIEQLK